MIASSKNQRYQKQENAKQYQEKSLKHHSVHFMELLTTVNIQPGWKVLDVGCGTGNNSVLLADVVGTTGKVIAIDPIDERIECAKKFCQRDNIEYSVDSAENVEKYGNDFDLIIASSVIHWIPSQNKRKVFQAIYNALGDGGIFIFLTRHEDSVEDLLKMFRLLGDTGKQMEDCLFFETADTYLQHAGKVGFKNSSIEKRLFKTRFESIEKIFELYTAAFHKGEYFTILTNKRQLKI